MNLHNPPTILKEREDNKKKKFFYKNTPKKIENLEFP